MILENLLMKIHNVKKLHVLSKGYFKHHVESTHKTINRK